ncbi:MAG: glycosyltransferase family 4 protein [Acidiphilium sp.]|nr:glycosyltransferase family 4 protein [Acidiphilium sp.]MDD4935657.1 glycosyltransferase family 4 protein [Acidiphilium sp.]
MKPERRRDRTIAMVLPPREGFAPDRAGAIAMVVRRLAGAANATVIGGAHPGTQPGAPYPGIAFTAVAARSPVFYGIGVLRRLRALSPGIVEIHQQPRLACVVAWVLPQARVSLFLHNDPLTMRGLRYKAQRARMLRTLHNVVCVSEYLRQRYATGLAATDGLVVLPNPLTLAELPPRSVLRPCRILFAGRIVENKGVADFIAAVAAALPALPGWSAQIIGGDRFGPNSPETPFVSVMRQAACAAGIGFAGYRPHESVLAAMAEAAIVVVPSRWPEPFGLAALEALASGAALIATDSGGLPEMTGDAARLVPPGDIPALTDAIIALASDDDTRATLARTGLARAAQFDTPVIAARLQALRDGKTGL